MKKCIALENWKLREATAEDLPALRMGRIPEDGDWLCAGRGLQVQEVLLAAGRIDSEVRVGKTDSARWISEKDWIYTCDFTADPAARACFLHFGGLDTVADIYLNGEHIAFHDDMYLPLRLNVSGKLHNANTLCVYFHAPDRVVRERLEAMPAPLREKMDKISVIRKCSLDFGDFGGVTLTTVGLFEDVTLESVYTGEIECVDIRTRFNQWRTRADIDVDVRGLCFADGMTVRASLFAPDGALRLAKETDIKGETYDGTLSLKLLNPELWWPKNYGEQPVYQLTVELMADGKPIDSVRRTLGLRELVKTGDMRFRVNGVEIKLWGGNIVPLYGLTHRFDDARCAQLMTRLDNMNVNILRMWGGGMQYGDSFYEACDRMGIMVYQDFFLHWAYYAEDARVRRQYYEEALYTVRRLKHHACILLWSGGNETLMHNEENTYEKYDISYAPFREDFARAAREADPDRFYLESSPAGGDYPSDPSEGDGHPLYYTYRHSVEKYPVFVSESARTSTGPIRSLRRFMTEEEIWPEGYVNQVTYNSAHPNRERYFKGEEKFFIPLWKRVPAPETWRKWSAGFFAGETAAIERFYEADDGESLVYRYNAAYADFMRTYSEGVRRGKPYFDTQGKRVPTGYMLWKINDTWPQFYCSLIDFFMETYIPYYQVKRSYSPVLLSFETENHLLLWGINDTAREVRGTLRVVGFSQAYNRIMREFSLPVVLESGESRVLTNLDRICPVIREWVLYASLTDEAGHEIARSDTFIELERYLTFPEAVLSLTWADDCLTVTTDRFAHCVELGGGEDGQEFGWLFEDNYFNLLPFEQKRIRILESPEKGVVHAKAHYSPTATRLEIERGTK